MYLFIISKILKYSIIHNRRGLKAKRLDFNAFEPFPWKVGKEERCSEGKKSLKAPDWNDFLWFECEDRQG